MCPPPAKILNCSDCWWLSILLQSAVRVSFFVLNDNMGLTWIILDALGIYLLNLFLGFLQPKFDPSVQDDLMADEIEEGGIPLQTSPKDDEFRPFVRRLPEWKFW